MDSKRVTRSGSRTGTASTILESSSATTKHPAGSAAAPALTSFIPRRTRPRSSRSSASPPATSRGTPARMRALAGAFPRMPEERSPSARAPGAPSPSRRARRGRARPRRSGAAFAGPPWQVTRRRGPPATRADPVRRTRTEPPRQSAATPAKRRRRSAQTQRESRGRGKALPARANPLRRSRSRTEGVDQTVLVLAQLLGGDEVGRWGEEETVRPLSSGFHPGTDLVEWTGGAVGVDHLVADRGGDGSQITAAERLAGGNCIVGEAVQLPEGHVSLDRRVEGDRAASHLDRLRLVVVDRAADGRQVVESLALASGAAQALLEGGDHDLVDPAQALDRVSDQTVGDVARHPAHPPLHSRGVDRHRLASRRVRPDPALDVDVVVVAPVADRLSLAGLMHDQPGCLNSLTQVGRRLAVLGVVPGFVQALDTGAEPEPKAPARHLVDVQGTDCDDEGAAGKGPGNPGGDPDLLGPPRQIGGLGDRGAEQLRGPDTFHTSRFGTLGFRLEVGDGDADRGDGDAVQGAQAGEGTVASAKTRSATRSRCQRASPKVAAFALPRLRKKWRSCSQVKPIPPCTWIEASGTRQPASEA